MLIKGDPIVLCSFLGCRVVDEVTSPVTRRFVRTRNLVHYGRPHSHLEQSTRHYSEKFPKQTIDGMSSYNGRSIFQFGRFGESCFA